MMALKNIAVSILVCVSCVTALDNGAALTPPMGFSTWNCFHTRINQEELQEVAMAMKQSGMIEAGYKFFNIDDGWPLEQRAGNGSLLANPTLFPNGMGAFSTWLNEEVGMTLGIYTSHSNKTCQSYPGSLGYEKIDAQTYANWGVGFVKNDWCAWRTGHPGTDDNAAFSALRDALNATGKPMVYSIHWNYASQPSPNGKIPQPQLCNMWRVGGDISPKWDAVLRLIDTTEPLANSAGPGSWNDADMLEVGNGMTFNEDRAHFSMWAMLASPLIAGNDIRKMSNETQMILTNKQVISVNQDKLGKQATVLSHAADNSTQSWIKPLEPVSGTVTYALALLNRAEGNATITADVKKLDGCVASNDCCWSAIDLWSGETSTIKNSVTVTVGEHDIAIYKIMLKNC